MTEMAVKGDNIYIVWGTMMPSSSIFFRRSTNGGATFEPAQNLSGGWSFGEARLSVSDWGLFAGWRMWDLLFRSSLDGGTTWSNMLNLSEGFGFSGVFNIDSNGPNVYVTWTSSSGILYRRSTNGGITFEPVQNLCNNCTEVNDPFFAVAGANVYLLWWTGVNWQGDIFYRQSVDNGATFEPPPQNEPAQNVSNTPGGTGGVKAAVSSQGILYLVWEDATPGNSDIFFRAIR